MLTKPDHSDILIHWTGRDIDQDYDPCWWKDDCAKKKTTTLDHKLIKPYLERLRSILDYGIWMTKDNDKVGIKNMRGVSIARGAFARACFTELKVSDALLHAKKYGRLGIGFKRFFVFERLGGPAFYYRPDAQHLAFASFQPKGRMSKGAIKANDEWTYFLKSMNEHQEKNTYIAYPEYEESEWRIAFSEKIEKKLLRSKYSDRIKYFMKPTQFTKGFKSYIKRKKLNPPEYLLPLRNPNKPNDRIWSRWLAIIIYPTLAVKVASEAHQSIRKAIERLKPTCDQITDLSQSAAFEAYSKPFEIDIQACKNF